MDKPYKAVIVCTDPEKSSLAMDARIKTGGEMGMSRLDDTISNVAYILDSLMTLRNILETGDCNTCEIKLKCRYAPNPGQIVRYNCPHYIEKVAKRDG